MSRAPVVYSSIQPARPTQVYDTFWKFAAERQAIFFRKLRGVKDPLTDDAILRRYKFTNAYRASDRVSQFLIRHVIYQGEQTAEEVFFRIILFKLFNRIETWQLLEQKVGPIRYSEFDIERYDAALSHAFEARAKIYSAAYIMPPARFFGPERRKHRTHLQLLKHMMDNEAPARVFAETSMRQSFELLRTFPMIGDFLGYQFIIDLNYSDQVTFDEMDFVRPGPGALDGIRKCFSTKGGLSDADIIRMVTDRQEEEFERLGLEFKSLWGRPLQLIDCQNLFCEISKYARVAHPEVEGLSSRKRIKQLYARNWDYIPFWYPPKWGLNSRIQCSEG